MGGSGSGMGSSGSTSGTAGSGAGSGATDAATLDSTTPDATADASDAGADGAGQTTGSDGDAGICASCGAGSVCVEEQVVGGAIVLPDDAGQPRRADHRSRVAEYLLFPTELPLRDAPVGLRDCAGLHRGRPLHLCAVALQGGRAMQGSDADAHAVPSPGTVTWPTDGEVDRPRPEQERPGW
jgi:hypothetical protein